MSTRFNKGTFITIPNRCTLATVGGSAQAVYMWLSDMMDDEGKCWPSHSLLAKRTGFSRPTIKRSIDKLVVAGVLVKENRFNNKEQTTNMYYLTIKDTERCSLEEDTLPLGVSQGVETCELGGVNVRATELNPLNQTQLTNTTTNVVGPKALEPEKDFGKKETSILKEPTESGTPQIPNPLPNQGLVVGEERIVPAAYGSEAVRGMLSTWEEVMGYPIDGDKTKNRWAANNLSKKYTLAQMTTLLRIVRAAHADKYARKEVKCVDLVELQRNANAVMAYALSKKPQQEEGVTRYGNVTVIR